MPTINQLPLRSPVSPGDQIPIYSPNNGDARRTPVSAVVDLVVNGLDLPNTAVLLTGNQTVGGTKTFSSAIVGDITGNAGSVTNGVYTVGNQTIGGTKTFSSAIVGDITGNAGSVTNGVYTTGNQTIGGTKTFSSAIVGDITGNAGSVTNGVYTTGNQTIGGTKTFSSAIVGDITGNAATATTATTATTASSVTNGVYTVGDQTIGGTKTFSVNPILSAGTVNAILTLDGSKQISAVSGLTWNSTTFTFSLGSSPNEFYLGRGSGGVSTNVAVGVNALTANTTGNQNVAVGESTLLSNVTGFLNTAIGKNALFFATGSYNTAVGGNAGTQITTGIRNTLVGESAGSSLSNASNNTLIGQGAGSAITTSSSNTIIGGFNGNQAGLDIRTATSGNIVLSDGGGNPRAYYDATNSSWYWRTGATERMRINSAGFVGINAESIGLSTLLTVNGVASFAAGTAAAPALTTIGDLDTGVFFPAANNWAVATGGVQALAVNPSGGLSVRGGGAFGSTTVAGNTSVNLASGTTDYTGLTRYSNGLGEIRHFGTAAFQLVTHNAADILFYATNSERMRITSGGNVGIGTTNPNFPLHVAAAGNNRLAVESTTSGAALIGLYAPTGALAAFNQIQSIVGATEHWAIGGNGWENTLTFKTNGQERMRISSNGNVAIGGQNAVTKLAIYDSNVGLVVLNTSDPAAATSAPMLRHPVASGFSSTPAFSFWYSNAGMSMPAAETLGLVTNSQERMRITSAGDVGIGTNNPAVKLEVAGQIRTEAPTGGTAANWRLGTVHTVSPTSPNRTIEVDIGGTIYYLHAKTTNN